MQMIKSFPFNWDVLLTETCSCLWLYGMLMQRRCQFLKNHRVCRASLQTFWPFVFCQGFRNRNLLIQITFKKRLLLQYGRQQVKKITLFQSLQEENEPLKFPPWILSFTHLSHLCITFACSANFYIYFAKYGRKNLSLLNNITRQRQSNCCEELPKDMVLLG